MLREIWCLICLLSFVKYFKFNGKVKINSYQVLKVKLIVFWIINYSFIYMFITNESNYWTLNVMFFLCFLHKIKLITKKLNICKLCLNKILIFDLFSILCKKFHFCFLFQTSVSIKCWKICCHCNKISLKPDLLFNFLFFFTIGFWNIRIKYFHGFVFLSNSDFVAMLFLDFQRFAKPVRAQFYSFEFLSSQSSCGASHLK